LLIARAQRDLLDSQLEEVEARVEFRKALVDFYRLEGTLLIRRGIAAPGRHLASSLTTDGSLPTMK
jgi:outer membrane protein